MKDQFDLQNNLTTHAKIMIRDNKDLSYSKHKLLLMIISQLMEYRDSMQIKMKIDADLKLKDKYLK